MAKPLLYQVGTRLAERFELVETLGQGASGVVYKAIDHEMLGQLVAVKVLYPHLMVREQVVTRFRNEVRIARELAHPHIVRFFEWCTTGENAHLVVMELVPGVLLRRILDGRPDKRLPLKEAIRVLYQISSALQAAHEKGIVHRDLKPDNLMLDDEGNVKILDFGIARVLDDEQGLTKTGESMGTPFYMSPEQFRGQPADPRSDIYSLGILAYQLVTGALPFSATVFYQLASQHLSAPLPSFPKDCDAPEWLRELIANATRKKIEERYQSGEEMAAVLAVHVEEGALEGTEELLRAWRAHEQRLETRRRRRARIRRGMIPLEILLAIVLAFWIVTQVNPRQWRFVAEYSFDLEHMGLGALVWPVKKLFGINDSCLEPSVLSRAYRDFLDFREAHPEQEKATLWLDGHVRALLRSGSDPMLFFERDGRSRRLIFWFAEREPIEFLEDAKDGPEFDPNVRDIDGRTLLSVVTSAVLGSSDRAALKMICEHRKVDLEAADRGTGDTAMHLAIRGLDGAVFDILAFCYARQNRAPNQRNALGFTPFEMALEARADIQETFVSSLKGLQGLDLTTPNKEGRTTLEYAAAVGEAQSFDLVLRALQANQTLPPVTPRLAQQLMQRGMTSQLLALREAIDASTATQPSTATVSVP